VLVYSCRKKLGKTKLVVYARSGSRSPNVQELGGPSLFEEALHQDHAQGLCLVLLIRRMLVKVMSWSWIELSFFCNKMGLAIEGREMELISFLALLEAIRMKGDQLV